MNQQQFENFTASSLYCEKCKTAMPVRERLLLVLPDREIFDYLCTECGSSVGRREITAGETLLAQSMARRRPRPSTVRHQLTPLFCMLTAFIATGEIGVPTLQALLKSEHEIVAIVTQPDKPVGREQKIKPPPIKKALAGTAMPILQPMRIKDRELIEAIGGLRPDAMVVIAY